MPATIATTLAAAKALRMKSYSNMARMRPSRSRPVGRGGLVPVFVALDVTTARHDEDPALEAHDLDLGSVQPRQDRAGDDLLDRAERGLAAPEIEHPVERAEQRVQL